MLTASALLGGIGGILLTGHLVDGGASYGSVIASMALAQLVVVVVVIRNLPETAHQELEALNPEDALCEQSGSVDQQSLSQNRVSDSGP